MCRFIAYLGKKAIILNDLLEKPENSLVNQSRASREGKQGLNGDGFGIGWYDHSIDDRPGLFKSVQPAWNDQNVRHLAAKIRSQCFVGHVRASTVGDVNTFNCHPFGYQEYLFVHNGTIREFETIKRSLLCTLSNPAFDIIRGQTDSEHFFALFIDILRNNLVKDKIKNMVNSLLEALKTTINLFHEAGATPLIRLNSALTDGKSLIATRYVSNSKLEPLSLHYTKGTYIEGSPQGFIAKTNKKPNAIIVASEQLPDYAEEWQEIPVNHLLIVDTALNLIFQPIDKHF